MSAKKKPATAADAAPEYIPGSGSVFQSAFEASLAVMYLVDPQTGTLLDANPAAEVFYGIPRAELRGQPLTTLSILPLRKIKSLLASIRKHGGAHFASQHRLRNGEVRDVEIDATSITLPGGRASVFVILHDVTARAQAERALLEREGLLQAILDSAGDGIGFKDKSHIYREANPAFCQLLAHSCQEVLGRKSSDFFDRRKSSLHVESDRRVMRERVPVVYESAFTGPNGTRTLSVHKAPVLDGKGDCLGVVFITHDITEQRAAEAALRHSEGMLRAILQSAQDSISVTDAAGIFIEVNQAFCELVGKPREAVLGQPLSAVYDPEELRIQQSTRQLVLDTQGPVNFTQRIKRPGHDSWVNVVKTPVVDVEGRCLGVVSMGRDITSQKTSEIALRESERRYSVLVHQSPVGVFETDAKGRLTFANDRMLRLAGRTLEQMLGTEWLTCIHPEGRQEFVHSWHKALSARREFSAETRLRTPRGVVQWVSVLIRPMRDSSSRVIGYLGALSDISERKKAEALREDVDKVIRHDLKSPLGAMGNAAELLEMLGPLNPEQAQVLTELRALSKRMHGLVSLSLDLRAMETGRYVLDPVTLDLGALIEALRMELRPHTEGKDLRLRIELEGDGPLLVVGERRLVDTVFVNLLKNAAEASPEGEEILVRLRAEAGQAVVTLHNKGAVPPDIRERFFEKYATSGKVHGTGLGTYSARLMVRALGGAIEVDTSEPDATTLVVSLPLAEQDRPAV